MRKIYLLILLLPIFSNAQQFEWANTFGGTQADNAQRVAPAPQGGVFVAGNFQGPATFGQSSVSGYGFQDVYIARYSATGNLLWVKAIGGSGNDQVSALAADPMGNVWVSGRFTGNIDVNPDSAEEVLVSNPANGLDGFFVRLQGETGALLDFVDLTPGGVIDIRSIRYNYDNNELFLGGQFSNTVDFDFGAGTASRSSFVFSGDGFIGKYDTDLNLQWINTIGSTTPVIDYVSSLSFSNDGFVYCTGLLGGTADIDPGPGTTNLTCATDAFLIKYNSNTGALGWGFNLGGNSIELGNQVLVTPDNQILLSGSVNSVSMDVDPGFGNVILSTNGISAAPFLLRYTSAGAYVNGFIAEGVSGLSASFGTMAYTPENQLLLSGSFTGTLTLPSASGTVNLVSGASSDGFLIYLNENNQLVNLIQILGTGTQTVLDIEMTNSILHVVGQLEGNTNPGADALNDVVPSNNTLEGYLFRYNLSPTGNFTALTANPFALKAWPNPAKDILNLNSQPNDAYRVQDLSGKTVIGGVGNVLDMSALSPGMYIITATTENGPQQIRVLRTAY